LLSSSVKSAYPIFAPQPPQNFVPGGLSIPHALHFADAVMGFPQVPQKRIPCAFFAPHFAHVWSSIDAPQLLQNFPAPASWPQDGHIVVLLSMNPDL
jgi:hypothetical protein